MMSPRRPHLHYCTCKLVLSVRQAYLQAVLFQQVQPRRHIQQRHPLTAQMRCRRPTAHPMLLLPPPATSSPTPTGSKRAMMGVG